LGIGESFDGTFFRLLGFGCYLAPLAVLELYLRAKESTGTRERFAMAAGLLVLTLLMGVGIFALTMFTWQFLARI
jgi:hypothetical protein